MQKRGHYSPIRNNKHECNPFSGPFKKEKKDWVISRYQDPGREEKRTTHIHSVSFDLRTRCSMFTHVCCTAYRNEVNMKRVLLTWAEKTVHTVLHLMLPASLPYHLPLLSLLQSCVPRRILGTPCIMLPQNSPTLPTTLTFVINVLQKFNLTNFMNLRFINRQGAHLLLKDEKVPSWVTSR